MSNTAPASAAGDDVFRQGLFTDKVVFCTGGRSGICYAIVEAMMALGADAVIVGRDATGLESSARALEKSTGRRCLAAPADVRDPRALQAAVQRAEERYGKVNYVICGAAGNFLAPISGLSENAFRTVVEIDLLGTYNTIKATLPLVRAARGAFVHVSATLHYRGTPWQAHVSAAKAGVDALSAALAVEEGPHGVRSNVIAPGPIGGTEGMSRLRPEGSRMEAQIPLQRLGSTRDIANAAVFLFSPAAAYVTGSVLVVDGGHWHTAPSVLPYPDAVLDPESARRQIKARM